jgi:hypothetical protein
MIFVKNNIFILYMTLTKTHKNKPRFSKKTNKKKRTNKRKTHISKRTRKTGGNIIDRIVGMFFRKTQIESTKIKEISSIRTDEARTEYSPSQEETELDSVIGTNINTYFLKVIELLETTSVAVYTNENDFNTSNTFNDEQKKLNIKLKIKEIQEEIQEEITELYNSCYILSEKTFCELKISIEITETFLNKWNRIYRNFYEIYMGVFTQENGVIDANNITEFYINIFTPFIVDVKLHTLNLQNTKRYEPGCHAPAPQ